MKCAKMTFCITALLAFILAGPEKETGLSEVMPPQKQNDQAKKYANCLECHDNYTMNHHPVNFKPIRDIPFPLTDGKITCRTCHFGDHESGGTYFLRGGPYLQQRDMCFECHHQKNYAGINPHRMLDKNGNIIKIVGEKPICIVCHVSKPDPETDITEDVEFRADVGFLCWRCHQPMANALFQHQHLLVKPSREMRKTLEKNEKKMNVLLPLIPRDRVTCSTCHNPHQKGVILREAVAKGADAPARLRVPSPLLCSLCHSFSNI
jgi:predicted CXXCH cytochrome family protein